MPVTRYQRDKGTYRHWYQLTRWRKLRGEVMRDYRWMCGVCAQKGIWTAATEVDHINPVSKMKLDVNRAADKELFFQKSNLQAICRSCHKSKSDGEKKPVTRWARYVDD